jgi:hypothetical protein
MKSTGPRGRKIGNEQMDGWMAERRSEFSSKL